MSKKLRLSFGILVSVSCFLLTGIPVLADWDYISTDKMIKYSDAVAVIKIEKVDKVPEAERASIRFGQVAQAEVETQVKGHLEKSITVYGGINVDGFKLCVPDVVLKPGRFLACLKQSQVGWSTVNADHGFVEIADNHLNWWKGNIAKPSRSKLSEVLKEIQGPQAHSGTWLIEDGPSCKDSMLRTQRSKAH